MSSKLPAKSSKLRQPIEKTIPNPTHVIKLILSFKVEKQSKVTKWICTTVSVYESQINAEEWIFKYTYRRYAFELYKSTMTRTFSKNVPPNNSKHSWVVLKARLSLPLYWSFWKVGRFGPLKQHQVTVTRLAYHGSLVAIDLGESIRQPQKIHKIE